MKKMVGKPDMLTPVIGAILIALVSSNSVLAAPVQPSVEDRLQRIERIIENPVLLQMSRRLGEQQQEIQELQDQIDFLKRDLRNMKSVSDKRYKETDDRLSVLETTAGKLDLQGEERFESSSAVESTVPNSGVNHPKDEKLAGDTVVDEQAVEGLTPVSTHPATKEEQDAYQLAFNLIKSGRYDSSIQAFQSFLDNHAQSELASNASYWMGEALYIKKDHQAALDAFNVVIKRYPHSSKVADAMLRAGDSLGNVKQAKEAKEMYAELMARYPKTRAAEKALKRLEYLQ